MKQLAHSYLACKGQSQDISSGDLVMTEDLFPTFYRFTIHRDSEISECRVRDTLWKKKNLRKAQMLKTKLEKKKTGIILFSNGNFWWLNIDIDTYRYIVWSVNISGPSFLFFSEYSFLVGKFFQEPSLILHQGFSCLKMIVSPDTIINICAFSDEFN